MHLAREPTPAGGMPVQHGARGLRDDLLSFFPSRAIPSSDRAADDAVGGLSLRRGLAIKEDKDRGMTLSIIIPCYNERSTIQNVVDTVLRVPLSIEREVVVVDDFSKDGTRDI